MGKYILLEDLKAILNNGVMLHRWNDEKEDFEIVYRTEVFEHNNADIEADMWQAEVLSINAYNENGINYTMVEIG